MTCASGACTVSIWNNVGSVNIAVDVDGWFTTGSGAQFTPLATPARICDTLAATATCAKAPLGAVTCSTSASPDRRHPVGNRGCRAPTAIVANVTAVAPRSRRSSPSIPGRLSQTHPGVSDLNVGCGTVLDEPRGRRRRSGWDHQPVQRRRAVNLIVDVLGYYRPGPQGRLPRRSQSTLVGPGQADMYPVDVTNDAQYYFVLDAGNYRIVAVNRTTDASTARSAASRATATGRSATRARSTTTRQQ